MSHTWTKASLPKKVDGKDCIYTVEEEVLSGFQVSYTNNDGILEGDITVTNKKLDSTELPDTGGIGNLGYYAIGALFVTATLLVYIVNLRKRGLLTRNNKLLLFFIEKNGFIKDKRRKRNMKLFKKFASFVLAFAMIMAIAMPSVVKAAGNGSITITGANATILLKHTRFSQVMYQVAHFQTLSGVVV